MNWHCCVAEDEKAHVYASHARPEWWPEGWDWSSRALEAANRLQLEAFFLPMRDWKASHQAGLHALHCIDNSLFPVHIETGSTDVSARFN